MEKSKALAAQFSSTAETERNARPALTLDVALYQQYLDDADLSEAEKREFLETLWSVIVGFVDLGFGVHPLQQAAPDLCDDELCGQVAEMAMPGSPVVLDLSNPLPEHEFAGASENKIGRPVPKEKP